MTVEHTSLAEVVGQRDAAPAPSVDVSTPAAEPATTTDQGEQSATPAPVESAADHADDSGDDRHPVPRKALLEERKKRQELERQLAETSGRLSAYSQIASQQQQQQAPPKDEDAEYWSDPRAWTKRQLDQTRLSMSVEMVRGQYADYDQAVAALQEAARSAPHLEAQVFAAANPALAAYKMGKTYLQAKEYGGDIDTMRAKIREEVRAEVEKELRAKGALAAAENASTSSAGARGSGASTTPAFTGPTPLRELFPSRI
jgi:hypothetical protein